MFQVNPDTSIHFTLGGSVLVLVVKTVIDEVRKGKNGNGNEVRDILKEQTIILREISKDIAVVKDRTK